MNKESSNHDNQTHFGFHAINIKEKINKVSNVFRSVASKYDLMNDLMSFGLHRFWKSFSIQRCNIQRDQTVLDVASGTGDLSCKIARQLNGTGSLHLFDLQINMLQLGRKNMIDAGFIGNIYYAIGDAEKLPYQDNQFDCLTIGFGLRNITNMQGALTEFYRVIKLGGKLMILEFSKPNPLIQDLYDWYSFNIIPWLGDLVTHDRESYQYLVESIRMHPGQEDLMKVVLRSGFKTCLYEDISGGIVSIHMAYK